MAFKTGPTDKLTPRTREHIAALFSETLRDHVAQLLITECGNNLPFLNNADEFSLERYRFAVLRLSRGDMTMLKRAIDLAQVDWRDLLVAAGFADDPTSYLRWEPRNDNW